MKKHKNKIIVVIAITVALVFVYWYGGDAPLLRGWIPKTENTVTIMENEKINDSITSAKISDEDAAEEVKETDEIDSAFDITQNTDNLPISFCDKEGSEDAKVQNWDESDNNGIKTDENTGRDKYMTEPVPEGKPEPFEPQNAVVSDEKLTCTLSVRCDTIIKNIGWLNKEKIEIVPKDGVIFPEQNVVFYEGESVFNLLLREMKQNKIHMEFENVPLYNSAYIEGIANIYEFDCGELSGWMYKVNGWFPNYGCSRYQLKAGDKVEWVYTCNLGSDVGGSYAAK